jgi:type II secretory pathway component PulF
MKLYYRAVDTEGKSISGLIDARDVKEVAFYLRSHNMVPIKITPAADRVKFHIPRNPNLKTGYFLHPNYPVCYPPG